MLQHHHFGPDEERPLGLRARRGRLPSVRTGDPPPAVGFGNMTMERVTVTAGAAARSPSSILWRRMDSLNLLHVTEKITDLPACLPACNP